MKKRRWTENEIEYLKKNYSDSSNLDIAIFLNRTINAVEQRSFILRLYKSPDYIKKLANGAKTQFKGGHKAWNKGTKGLFKGSEKTCFKPGHIPYNTLPIGSMRIDVDGYIDIKVKEHKWKLYHRYLWEKENGAIPKGYVLVFKDGNKQNVVIENLELITMKENMKRNAIYNYPEEVQDLIRAKGSLTRAINNLNNNNINNE